VSPAPDRTLDLAEITPALWREGVREHGVRILADGIVERDGDVVRFRIDGWPEAYPVDGPAPAPGRYRFEADGDISGGRPRLRART
jgi:hypothetical protein